MLETQRVQKEKDKDPETALLVTLLAKTHEDLVLLTRISKRLEGLKKAKQLEILHAAISKALDPIRISDSTDQTPPNRDSAISERGRWPYRTWDNSGTPTFGQTLKPTGPC